MWGWVPRENLRGPALFVWWPPHRIHWIGDPREAGPSRAGAAAADTRNGTPVE
jgi:hypothetical protein